MRPSKYHVSINSIYVMILRIRFDAPDYIKAHIRYYSKSSDTLLQEVKNVKIMKSTIKHWERWNG